MIFFQTSYIQECRIVNLNIILISLQCMYLHKFLEAWKCWSRHIFRICICMYLHPKMLIYSHYKNKLLLCMCTYMFFKIRSIYKCWSTHFTRIECHCVCFSKSDFCENVEKQILQKYCLSVLCVFRFCDNDGWHTWE